MMVRSVIAFSAFIFSLLQPLAFADTTAFGMTLGKTTQDEFKKEYPSAIDDGVSAWTGGGIFSVPVKDLEFEGIKSSTFIFTKDGRLTAIAVDFNKDLFDKIHGMLSRKYKVSKKNIPFVGNRFVRYQNGDDIIELDSPHLSFDMNLTYAEKDFMNMYLEKKNNQERQKESKELDKL